jgi:TolB protein
MGFWLINSDGTNMRRVSYPLEEPAWSPDGQWIAFISQGQIFKMRFLGEAFDTTMPIQLTYQGNNFSPAWSPDGQWIAYDRPLADSSGPGGIWLMRSDGTWRRSLFGAAFPTWHPNNEIILGAVGTSSTSIWTRFLRYDVTRSVTLGALDAVVGNDNRNPRYSPDGTKIAFSSKPSQGNGNIWVMNSNGSNLRQLTIEGSTTGLSWSPDGRRIAYVSYRFTDWSYANGTIWTIDVETGEQTQLTFNYPPAD